MYSNFELIWPFGQKLETIPKLETLHEQQQTRQPEQNYRVEFFFFGRLGAAEAVSSPPGEAPEVGGARILFSGRIFFSSRRLVFGGDGLRRAEPRRGGGGRGGPGGRVEFSRPCPSPRAAARRAGSALRIWRAWRALLATSRAAPRRAVAGRLRGPPAAPMTSGAAPRARAALLATGASPRARAPAQPRRRVRRL